jgi:hypothetical protein
VCKKKIKSEAKKKHEKIQLSPVFLNCSASLAIIKSVFAIAGAFFSGMEVEFGWPIGHS